MHYADRQHNIEILEFVDGVVSKHLMVKVDARPACEDVLAIGNISRFGIETKILVFRAVAIKELNVFAGSTTYVQNAAALEWLDVASYHSFTVHPRSRDELDKVVHDWYADDPFESAIIFGQIAHLLIPPVPSCRRPIQTSRLSRIHCALNQYPCTRAVDAYARELEGCRPRDHVPA